MKSIGYSLALASLGLALAMPVSALAQDVNSQPGSPQVGQPDSGGVNWKGAGIGAATLLANVGYIPAKTVYAILGGITGGAGYALTGGNQQTANSIWRSSLGGDYVLTPAMIRGEEPVHFSGPPNAMSTSSPATTGVPPVSYNSPPAQTASSVSVYPSKPAYSSTTTASSTTTSAGLGAPPLSVPSGRSGYSSSGTSSRFTTRITGPGDAGTGPVHESDIE